MAKAKAKAKAKRFKVANVGDRFGLMTVLEQAKRNHLGKRMVVCACDCGTKRHTVRVDGLIRGRSNSCGCLRGHGRGLAFRTGMGVANHEI